MNTVNNVNTPDSSAARAQGNRKIALGLGLFAVAVFLSILIRQWMANN